MQIIQVYAPTSSPPDEEIEDFCETLTNTHMQENCHFKIIMGYFNAKYQKVENHQQQAFMGQKKGTIEEIVSWNLQKAQKCML